MLPNQNSTERKDIDANGHPESIGRQQKITTLRDYPNSNPYDTKPGEKPYKVEIKWRYVFIFTYFHVASVIAFFLPITGPQFLFGFIYGLLGSHSVTAGAHRYWAHKCYKATRPLFFILLFFQTISLQFSVIDWVRNHRVHHKYTDTNADPHNSSRGFFFSHIGWLMCKEHPDVTKYAKRIDISDLTSDPVLRFQKKYYWPLAIFCSFLLPIFLSVYVLDAPFWAACHWHIFRFVVFLHITLNVNSISHIWGSKPFEKDIKATDTFTIGFLAWGEGWHNYHHVYPYDYKASEMPGYRWNTTTMLIDFFAWLGWAYDLKTVSDEMVRRRVLRTGDGSHRYSIEAKKKATKELVQSCTGECTEEEGERLDEMTDRIREHYWGWGDDDMQQEDINDAKIINPRDE
ncbi:hypothetical protein HA402_009162 [Bradysia odoriphaga]|nr:hypothetical protein HA402_009162 [Bradysia odoriphaga]